MMQTEYIKSAVDGRTLLIRQWSIDRPKAFVQIIHGISEHCARYDHVALALNKAGYLVYSHDHRSFGGSMDPDMPEFSIRGHFADEEGWDKAQLDTLQIQAAFSVPSKPTFLLAHSMGSFIAQSLMQRIEFPYAGVALSGTRGPVHFKDKLALFLARFERWRVGPRNSSGAADWFMEQEFNRPFKPTRTPLDWICSDPKVVDAYEQDPLCGGQFSTQLACDIAQALVDIYTSGFQKTNKALPLHLFSGHRDPVSNMGKSVIELEVYLLAKSFENVSLKLYDGCRHEVLNDVSKTQVLEDLISWLKRLA